MKKLYCLCFLLISCDFPFEYTTPTPINNLPPVVEAFSITQYQYSCEIQTACVDFYDPEEDEVRILWGLLYKTDDFSEYVTPYADFKIIEDDDNSQCVTFTIADEGTYLLEATGYDLDKYHEPYGTSATASENLYVLDPNLCIYPNGSTQTYPGDYSNGCPLSYNACDYPRILY